MRKINFRLIFFILLAITYSGKTQEQVISSFNDGYEYRIKQYVDSLRIIDNHEHLNTPAIIKDGYFSDFMLFFYLTGYDDLVSSGMPDSLFNTLYNEQHTPIQKWKIIEPYWKKTFNTTYNRIILNGLNESTVEPLSQKIKKAYSTDWFDRILRDSCRIDYIIQDGYYQPGKDDYFRYAQRFDGWLTVKSKYRIDSLAILQLEPIFTLDDYVKSMRVAFENEVKKGMVAVKISIAYSRTLSSERVGTETARKVFRTLVNGDEGFAISFKDAKPLQDYMLYQLLDLAKKYRLPVAIHTGLQAGDGNILVNSNPTLLTNIIFDYPNTNFILFHGSYPYGGELSALAKNFKNVYIDMNWTYAISPSYAERYLSEFLETVPAAKIIAFGGDMMVPENIYSELAIAKRIISNVLCNKVRDGFLSESEAKIVAKMILHDNAAKMYKLQ
jgi:predicted TIM-barrel fold metal-dependent hydrolase